MLATFPAMRSPLIRRITVVVFACIIAIETVLLGVSYFSQRQRLLDHVATAAEQIRPLFQDADSTGASLQRLLKNTQARYPLIGFSFVEPNGLTVQSGDYPFDDHEPNLKTGQSNIYDRERGIYTVFTSAGGSGDASPAPLALVFDVSYIDSALRDYVWRIVGLVLLIATFVTAGTLVALRPLLLTPLLSLRKLLFLMGRSEEGHIKAAPEYLNRADEIGDVYRAFDSMSADLARANKHDKATTERFREFASLGADCFWEIDTKSRLSFIAGDVSTMFGREPNALVGKPLRSVLRQRGMRHQHARRMLRALRVDGHWEGPVEALPGSHHRSVLQISARPIRDDKNTIIGARGIIKDVTLASQLAQKLERQASRDPLTSLWNRRAFDRALLQAVDAWHANKTATSVCVLDLDRFKAVNDRCGHAGGDALLLRISNTLRQHVRKNDFVARIGGDEFALLLSGCTLSQGRRITENIRNAIDRLRFEWENEFHTVGVSIGVAQIDEPLSRPSDVLTAADTACFRAKQAGRNQVHVFRADGPLEHHGPGTNTEPELALEGLRLFAQPVVPLSRDATMTDRSKDADYIEILARIRLDDGQLLTPDTFLPIFERNHQVGKFDERVVEMSLDWLRANAHALPRDSVFGINLSATSLCDSNFLLALMERIDKSKLHTEQLCFEIGESAASHDLSVIAKNMNRLRQLGCRIALDNFGTNPMSFEKLKHMRVDYLKIDDAYVQNLAHDKVDREVVRCAATIARDMGITPIAEAQADYQITELLLACGIRFAQGAAFGDPVPLESLAKNATAETSRKSHAPISN